MKKSLKESLNSVRLSKHIYPTHYKLHLHPDLLSFTFTGKEIIKVIVEKDTNQVTIHSKNLDIETVKYKSGKKEQFANKITYDTENETVTFNFINKIKSGKGELSIIFSGVISDSLRGFYKSKYTVGGVDKYIATTQFEATDARRCFPCFDEPAHKAIFEVSLVTDENHTAISNTLPIKIEKHNAGYKIINFAPSPKMSTYLLAFIIGEFEFIEGRTKNGVLVRVSTTEGKKHQAKFALDVAIKSLEFFNEYFGIPYPLPNLDLVAIPDFESGAMENWGAVTFRETALLVDDEHSSISNKQWVALVIAHELAHQWFGNLVTMQWWTDLWLNEGFASYIEYLAIDKIFPHWKIWNQFMIADYNVALKLDGLTTSHPIEIKVNHPNEINEIFDKISYSKGSSIIRMLALYLSEDKFKKGLQYYLKKHSYKNTETFNLWEAFEKVSGKPVAQIMNSWTKQMGYPLVDINTTNQKTIISQEKFFSSRVCRKNNKKKYLWEVPISYGNDIVLLNKNKLEINIEVSNKINHYENSFIRVKYDPSILSKIKNDIINNQMPTIDRLGMIRDAFDLAEAGYIKTSEALEFSLAYKNETEYIVWNEIVSGINNISNTFLSDSNEEKYKKYALSMISPLARKIGFYKKDADRHDDVFLRSLIMTQSASYGDKRIIKQARQIFKNREVDKIDANIRSSIYTIIAKNGGTKEWNILKQMYLDNNIQEEKDRCVRALTQFKDEKIIIKTLDFIMENKEVRAQDVPHLLAMIWTNKVARDSTWKFIKNNWEIILKKYGEGGHFLSRLLSPLGNHTKPSDLKDAKKFFSKKTAPGAERTLLQAYEKIESNVAWLKDDKKDIKKWLNKNY